MGTRHLIICKVDKKIKVANYGQWDGYLSGQGLTIAEFLEKKLKHDFDIDNFKNKLRTVYFLKPKELEQIDEVVSQNERLGIEYPRQFSRDTGAEILDVIYNCKSYAKKTLGLVDSTDFGDDDVMCEFTYVLDFDKKVLAIYTGGPKKNNLFKKLKFSEVTTSKIQSLAKELESAG